MTATVNVANGLVLENKTPSNVVTNTPTVTPPPVNLPPVAPDTLRASSVGPHRVDLIWRGSLTVATEVERAEMAGQWWRIGIVPAGTLHFIDNNVRKNRNYAYRVRSFNQFGYSAYSNLIYFGNL